MTDTRHIPSAATAWSDIFHDIFHPLRQVFGGQRDRRML